VSLSIWPFIKRVARSHLGHVLLAVSWSFILFVYVRPHLFQPGFVGCTSAEGEFIPIVDFFYPVWITAVGVAHLPSALLTEAVTKAFQYFFSHACGPSAKVEMFFFFAFSAIQWLLVGYTIESLYRRWRSRA
jgi:hypothetical protein